jgi:hypothetical protein
MCSSTDSSRSQASASGWRSCSSSRKRSTAQAPTSSWAEGSSLSAPGGPGAMSQPARATSLDRQPSAQVNTTGKQVKCSRPLYGPFDRVRYPARRLTSSERPRLRWSGKVLWAREELNLRPLPCQENQCVEKGWHRVFPKVKSRIRLSGAVRSCPAVVRQAMPQVCPKQSSLASSLRQPRRARVRAARGRPSRPGPASVLYVPTPQHAWRRVGRCWSRPRPRGALPAAPWPVS